MTRAEHIRALLEEYAQKRNQNALDLSAREQNAFALDPELKRLREENISIAMDSMRKVMRASTDEERRAVAENMRQRGLFNLSEIRRRLNALGLSENYLEEQPSCPLCRDTGYVGDAPARFCACFEKELNARIQKEYTSGAVLQETFETFLPVRIPEEDGQRQKTVRAKELCEHFITDYCKGTPRYNTLILTGPGGLGKTFLLNAVYARALENEKSAMRVTAFQMFDAMRRQHVGNDPEFAGFQAMVDAPLLLIDDLGSEPMMRNITVEYLFLLINERAVRKNATVIATNLSPDQILERYGERVASRLFDRQGGLFIRLEGKDLRRC